MEFAGKIHFGACLAAAEIEAVPGKDEWRGEHFCKPSVVEPFSYERLVGDYCVWNDRDIHGGGPTIFTGSFSIVNDEGAYEGLTAVANVGTTSGVFTWDGWMIDGNAPSVPQEPVDIP